MKPAAPPPDATVLLHRWRQGDAVAFHELVERIYGELRALGGRLTRAETPGGAGLDPTELVHEAYLRLVDQGRVDWRDRAHFLAVAAREMRRVLVERARARRALKRGGGSAPVALQELAEGELAAASSPAAAAATPDLLALDEALDALARLDPQQARVVELRHFGGLTVEETAVALDVSPATVKRDWSVARAWLGKKMTNDQ